MKAEKEYKDAVSQFSGFPPVSLGIRYRPMTQVQMAPWRGDGYPAGVEYLGIESGDTCTAMLPRNGSGVQAKKLQELKNTVGRPDGRKSGETGKSPANHRSQTEEAWLEPDFSYKSS